MEAAIKFGVLAFLVINHEVRGQQFENKTVRRRRALVFPTGSDVEFSVGLQIPIAALSKTSTTFDVDIPFTYNLPDISSSFGLGRRNLNEDRVELFQILEEFLKSFGIDGKACILKSICELAESRGLYFNGLLGKAFETVFLIDYGITSQERLYEYISARTYGEHHGNCDIAYMDCPFTIFGLIDALP